MMIIVMILITASICALAIAHFMTHYQKIATIVVDCVLGFAREFR